MMPRIYPQECLYNLTSSDSLKLVQGILASSMPSLETDTFYWCTGVERAPAGSNATDQDGTDVILSFLGLPNGEPFTAEAAQRASTSLVRTRGGEAPLRFPPIMSLGSGGGAGGVSFASADSSLATDVCPLICCNDATSDIRLL